MDKGDTDKTSVMKAVFSVQDWLYGNGKDKPVDIKAAMMWGALWVAHEHGDIDWDGMRRIFGEFMSHQMNLR